MSGTAEQKKQLQVKVGILYVSSLALLFFGIIFGVQLRPATPGPIQANSFTFSAFVTMARIVWIWATGAYARSRGQSPLLGVLGLFWIIGPIVISVLPDNYVVLDEGDKGSAPPRPTASSEAAVGWQIKPMPGTAFED